MISNGQICFGIKVNEFPWDEEPWYGDLEIWWRDVNGWVNPVPCPSVDDRFYKEYFNNEAGWDNAHPLPIELIKYHGGWILAIPSKIIESKFPEIFDPAELIVLEEELQVLLTFCLKWGITISAPHWWLSSY